MTSNSGDGGDEERVTIRKREVFIYVVGFFGLYDTGNYIVIFFLFVGR